jgi:tetratricopeptide (TPR) repeat protein
MVSGRLLWLGWDAADWGVIRPLIEAGEMPHLKALMERGASGELVADRPLLSQALWTSQASGVSPVEHGVLGPMELRPDRSGLWATGRGACRAARVWDWYEKAGLNSLVVNFPATHPVRGPLEGSTGVGLVQVSNVFFGATGGDDLRGAVWPAENLPALGQLRVELAAMGDDLLRGFIPEIEAIDRRRDPRPGQLAAILANVVSVHVVTTALLEMDWQFAAALYMGLHQAFHLFMAYHEPCHASISAEDRRRYGNVVPEMLRFHDMMLGRLVALAGAEARIVLTSDHGFAHGADRPAAVATLEQDLQAWHRERGVVVMAGAGIGAVKLPARTLEVAPALAALLGLERGPCPLPAVGAAPMGEAERYLRELGYKEQMDPGAEALERRVAGEREHYLGLCLLEAKRTMEAVAAFERARRALPRHRAVAVGLARACAEAGQWERCGELVGELQGQFPQSAMAALARGLFEMARRNSPAALPWVEQAAALAGSDVAVLVEIGEAFLRLRRLERAAEFFERARAIDGESARAAAGLAGVSLARGAAETAWQWARRAVEGGGDVAEHWRRLGQACMGCGDFAVAREAYERAVGLDAAMVAAWRGLAGAWQRLGEHEQANAALARAHAVRALGGLKQRGLTVGFGRALRAFE